MKKKRPPSTADGLAPQAADTACSVGKQGVAQLLDREQLLWSRPYWPREALAQVIRFASTNREFAAEVCGQLAVVIAHDFELLATLRKHVSAEQHPAGKPARPESGTVGYYGRLLSLYYVGRSTGFTHAEARDFAAELTAKGGVQKTDESIKNDLTKAHATVSLDQLAPELQEIARAEWPSHRARESDD